jgi:hypothetical protein
MKLFALTFTVIALSFGGLTACGGGGCDQLEDCNEALGGGMVSLEGGDDGACDQALDSIRQTLQAQNQDVPDACQ